MTTRWEVERAVFLSDLTSVARLTALTLLAMADAHNAVVPAAYTPSLSRLVMMTGLGLSTLKRSLNELEAAGWVIRKRPDPVKARAEKERTCYRLVVPKTRPTAGLARPTQGLGLGSERATGLGPQRATSQTALPDQEASKNQRAQSGPEDFVVEATGATPEEAAAIVKRIRNERNPRSLPGFLRTMARDGDLAQHLTEVRAAVRLREVEALWTAIKRGPECEHRMPGGAMPHPSTGEAVCLSCRKTARLGRAVIHQEAQ